MDKRLQIEGSAAAKLIQLIRKYGQTKTMNIEVGKVVSVNPISIHLESDNLVLDKNDLIIAEQLLKHKRSVSIDGETKDIVFNAHLKKNDQVIIIGNYETQMYYVYDKVGV